MTTTVTVRTRAWPATVSIEGAEDTVVTPHTSHDFHVTSNTRLSVVDTEPKEEVEKSEPVPGRAQNDELLKPTAGVKQDTAPKG